MGASPSTNVAPGVQKPPDCGEEPWAVVTDGVGGPGRALRTSLQGIDTANLPYQRAQLKVSTALAHQPMDLKQKHA